MENPYNEEVIVIRFDYKLLEEFSGYDRENPAEYFEAHPRSKKAPYEAIWGKKREGLIPSINKFLNVNDRRIQATWEKHLLEYCEYCMRRQGVKHNYIEKCIVVTINFKPTKSRSDNQNIFSKPFLDAMVERELLKDDNYTIVRLHQEFSVVDKDDPHSEIRIYPITDEFPFEVVALHVTNDLIELHNKYFKD